MEWREEGIRKTTSSRIYSKKVKLNLKDRTMLVEEISMKNNRMSGYEFLKKMVLSWTEVAHSVIRALGKQV